MSMHPTNPDVTPLILSRLVIDRRHPAARQDLGNSQAMHRRLLDAFEGHSRVDLGLPLVMADVDLALRSAFEQIFGETVAVASAPAAGVRAENS